MANGERMELAPVRLPYPAEAKQYGYSEDVWRVLTEAIFPNAQSQHSVTLALAYCKARGLDVMKRPIHIVPIWDSKRHAYVETIWPGIGELRTTASRTGKYAGKDDTLFGSTVTESLGGVNVTFPEWAQVTVYRIVDGVRCAFVGPKVYWKETYATKKHDTDEPNTMWRDRPSGQLEKCAEAAALRLAFPEEIGNDYAAEEMEGRDFETLGKTAEGHELLKPKGGPKRKSETAAAPAAANATPEPLLVPDNDPPPPQGGQADGPPNPWRGKVASVEKKDGSSKDPKTGKDKPYTLYTIHGKDGWKCATFSDTDADVASGCARTGEDIEVRWTMGKYGPKAESVQPAGMEAPAE